MFLSCSVVVATQFAPSPPAAFEGKKGEQMAIPSLFFFDPKALELFELWTLD